jgi:hypothetical protein
VAVGTAGRSRTIEVACTVEDQAGKGDGPVLSIETEDSVFFIPPGANRSYELIDEPIAKATTIPCGAVKVTGRVEQDVSLPAENVSLAE